MSASGLSGKLRPTASIRRQRSCSDDTSDASDVDCGWGAEQIGQVVK